MVLSVRLSLEEEKLLEETAQRLGRGKSDVARQAVRELCRKLGRDAQSPFDIGEELFDAGALAVAPVDPLKRQVWKKLREKHGYLG